MPTPNSQAVQISNSLISAANVLMGLYQQMQTIDQQWSDWSSATALQNMTTVTIMADGTLNPSLDTTINTTHPISVSVYPALGRSISATQITQLKTILDGVVNYVGGQTVTTQAGARAILNVAVGG